MNWSIFIDMLLVAGTLLLALMFIGYQIQQIQRLKRYGKPISAMVTSIRHETGKTQAGFQRDNYYVSATWTHPRTGRTYTFWPWPITPPPNSSPGTLSPLL